MSTARGREGFSLVEVLVVVSIVVVVAGLLLPQAGKVLAARENANTPLKVAELVKRAQSLAFSTERRVRVYVDYRARVASLQLKDGSAWQEVDKVALPSSLPEVVSAQGPVEVVFDERGLLALSPPGGVILNGKRVIVSRWGEVVVR